MVKSQPTLRYFLRLAPALAVTLLLSACSSNASTNARHDTHAVRDKNGLLLQTSQDEFEAMVRNVDIKSKIMDQYTSWKGVRYRLGGTNKGGIDCSAFVQRTFHDQFGLTLPRSTTEQRDLGRSISRTSLRSGDLVLFRTGAGHHIGIYLGNHQFVHASTSRGVTISSLDESYWNARYQQARRVLSNPPVARRHG